MSQPQLNRRSLLRLSAAAPAAALLPSEILFSSLLASPPTALPADARLQALKDLNGYFPFTPSATSAEWAARRDAVIRQIKVALGLWPMPERPPIQAVVHGRVEREDYTVDRVYFESSPGLLVTGSLYLPKAASASPDGTRPTILCPHGHWASGRFHDHGDGELKNQLQSGGETDPVGGRHPLQARCVQLARMGCMVFLYDMLGYADGSSLTQQLAHGFAKQRPELSRPDHWGLFSAQSELRCLNAMGLQTWNSIRALDWITSRPDCDRARIGCTGASGGGTQTFILTALDDRVAAAFPAVMVSTAMQGGCTCENASYLRVNTGNIEFAALAAPRPIAMTGADDWTVEIESKGFPELKRHYALLGAPDNVHAKYMKFPHNYNLPSRLMMYDFFNRTLNLKVAAIAERPYVPLTQQEATVFGDGHPAPDRSEAAEVALLRSLDAASQKQIAALTPNAPASLDEFRRVIGGALDVMIGRGLPPAGSTRFEKQDQSVAAGVTRFTGRLQLAAHAEELPCLWLLPDAWNQQAVLWIDGFGKSTLSGPDGTPIPPVASLLKAGFAVGSIDLLLTGEFTADGQPVKESPRVNNPREFAGYTFGYNHPLFAQRVHDILTLLSSTVFHERQPRKVHLVGLNGAAPHAIAAAAIAGKQLASLAVDTHGFRFAAITEIRDPNLLPGAVKYGDLPALLALCAPLPTAVAGETDAALSLTASTFRAASAPLKMLPQATPESLAVFVASQA
ncbi:MAG: alpha/beta hydrolase family protein [Planctomycetota bacterium]